MRSVFSDQMLMYSTIKIVWLIHLLCFLQVLLPHPLNDPTEFGSLQDLYCISRKEGSVYKPQCHTCMQDVGMMNSQTVLILFWSTGTWEVYGYSRLPVKSFTNSAQNKGEKKMSIGASNSKCRVFNNSDVCVCVGLGGGVQLNILILTWLMLIWVPCTLSLAVSLWQSRTSLSSMIPTFLARW